MLGNAGGLELLISPRYRPPTLLIMDEVKVKVNEFLVL